MSKNRAKITVAVDPKIDEELEKNSYNKSKLINLLLSKWIKSEKKELKNFTKKEFRLKSSKVYGAAYKHGWLNEICSHMPIRAKRSF